jgi:hypothetical protein
MEMQSQEDRPNRYYLKERHAEAVIKMKEVLSNITRPTSVAEIARQTGFNRVTVEKNIADILRIEPESFKEIGTVQLGNSLVFYRKSEREKNTPIPEPRSDMGIVDTIWKKMVR